MRERSICAVSLDRRTVISRSDTRVWGDLDLFFFFPCFETNPARDLARKRSLGYPGEDSHRAAPVEYILPGLFLRASTLSLL